MAKPKTLALTPITTGATDLPTAFSNAYTNFNCASAAGYAALQQFMHTDITLKKVMRRETITGIGNVVSYLNTQMLLANPAFSYDSTTLKYLPASPVNIGWVIGDGTYTDNNVGTGSSGSGGSRASTNVHFCWTFVLDDITKYWMLSNVYAYRIGV